MTDAAPVTLDRTLLPPRTQVSWVASRNKAIVQSLMAQKIRNVLQHGGRVVDLVLHDPDDTGVTWGWVAHAGEAHDGRHDDRCAGDPPEL